MLVGTFVHSLDDRGRVFLPSKHRDELGEEVVLSLGLDGQINLHSAEIWAKKVGPVAEQNQALSAARSLARMMFGSLTTCEVDKQGRLLIPQSMRTDAGLDTSVVIVGVNDHVEIWSQERWQKEWQRLLSESSAQAEQLASMGMKL